MRCGIDQGPPGSLLAVSTTLCGNISQRAKIALLKSLLCEENQNGGGGRTRTCEAIRRLIYSPIRSFDIPHVCKHFPRCHETAAYGQSAPLLLPPLEGHYPARPMSLR